MTNKPIWSIARYCALLVIGNAMFALGFNLFLVPNSLNVGGLSGIAMILQRARRHRSVYGGDECAAVCDRLQTARARLFLRVASRHGVQLAAH